MVYIKPFERNRKNKSDGQIKNQFIVRRTNVVYFDQRLTQNNKKMGKIKKKQYNIRTKTEKQKFEK